MFLEGEIANTQYLRYDISALLETYTQDDFRKDMFNVVEDPINRSLTIARAYKDAYQRGDQTVASFVAYLVTLEDQIELYTPAQRIRYLLVKLRRPLYNSITLYYQPLEIRDNLISLATRIETTEGKTLRLSYKYSVSELQNQPKKKKLRANFQSKDSTLRDNNSQVISSRSASKKQDELRYYNYNKLSYIRPKCPKLTKAERAASSTRKVKVKSAKLSRIRVSSLNKRRIVVIRSKASRQSRSSLISSRASIKSSE